MRKFAFLLSVFCFMNVLPSFSLSVGGMDPGAVNSQYMKDIRLHEVKMNAKKKNSAIVQPKTAVDKQEIPEVVPDLKSLVFVNNKHFSSSQLYSLVSDKIDKPLSAENISSIRRTIMTFYQNNGFYSAVPVIVSQDNTKGELVIDINEGPKNSIIFE